MVFYSILFKKIETVSPKIDERTTMVTITKNRLRTTYERAARALEAAQAAYDAIAAEHTGLFQHLDEMSDWYNDVESRLATDATQEEFDEVTEAWQNATDSVNDVSGDAWNILAGAKERAFTTYADYIA